MIFKLLAELEIRICGFMGTTPKIKYYAAPKIHHSSLFVTTSLP